MWSVPIGKPVDMRTDAKGLLTVTRYNTDEASNRILEAIKSDSLQGMSFTGVFLRSDPELTGPFSEYGPSRSGELPLVTRLEIALLEYGPTPIPAYDNAQVVGVRALQEERQQREVIHVLTPDEISARALTAAGSPEQMSTEIRQPMIHEAVKATPAHDTAPLATPDDATEAQWDTKQWETGMTFPADLDHMHSLYALYDTGGKFADDTYAKVSGHLPHHVVGDDGQPGAHHPDAVRAALEALPALPVTDEEREAARKHLEGHLKTTLPEVAAGATNGSGTGALASVIPTGSSGRDDDSGERERGDRQDEGEAYRRSLGIDGTMGDAQDVPHPFRTGSDSACLGCGLAEAHRAHAPDTWTGQMRAADEYAQAVLEMTGDGPAAADAGLRMLMGLVSGRVWDPDHDGDDDSTPAGDTDHDYWTAEGAPKLIRRGPRRGRSRRRVQTVRQRALRGPRLPERREEAVPARHQGTRQIGVGVHQPGQERRRVLGGGPGEGQGRDHRGVQEVRRRHQRRRRRRW